MLLALDIGNTNIVAALYDGDRQTGLWRFASDTGLSETAFQALLADSLGDYCQRCSRAHTVGAERDAMSILLYSHGGRQCRS